jgi:hypothetical protein
VNLEGGNNGELLIAEAFIGWHLCPRLGNIPPHFGFCRALAPKVPNPRPRRRQFGIYPFDPLVSRHVHHPTAQPYMSTSMENHGDWVMLLGHWQISTAGGSEAVAEEVLSAEDGIVKVLLQLWGSSSRKPCQLSMPAS